MSEADNLESLSNADLRAKMLEYGLANVPVTDSSRNVLIKKLRTSMGGGVSPSVAKKSSRRETIAVAERPSPARATPPVSENAEGEGRATPTRAANRRTIAATEEAPRELVTNPGKITSRRRSTLYAREQVTQAPAPASAPIAERRRSVRESPAKVQPVVATKLATIVIDSEDEDENDDKAVLAAAEQAERLNKQQNTRRSTSRAPSLSKTGVVTTTYNQGLSTLAEEQASPPPKTTVVEEVLPNMDVRYLQQWQRANQERQERITNMLPTHATARTAQQPSEPVAARFSVQSPLYRESNMYPSLSSWEPLGHSGGTAAARLRTYNEFSDDNEPETKKGQDTEDGIETPFLSNFARNLERLKAEPLGDVSRRYTRSRTAQEVTGRVAMHRERPQLHQRNGFLRWLSAFNQHWSRHLLLIIVIALVVYMFLKFWQ